MIRIESSALIVEVLPEVGGKIAQIRDKSTLWNFLIPAQRPYRTIPFDGDWLKHDTSGMDDCFPNVAADYYPEPPWTALQLPDLGLWTHGTWEVAKTSISEVVMEKAGKDLPYFATKTIRFLDDRTLQFYYRLENCGETALRYLWSAHPLFAVPDTYEILLPEGALTYQIFPRESGVHPWPKFNHTSLSSEWIAQGKTLKLFIEGLREGWCALRLPAYTLRFSFDLSTVPVVGLWFNNYGFPADGSRTFRCIAVEPCTSASDLLNDLDPGAYPRIAAGGAAQWSIQLSILPNHSGGS
jgi:hypothetical protein